MRVLTLFCYLFGIGSLLEREHTHRARVQSRSGIQIQFFRPLRWARRPFGRVYTGHLVHPKKCSLGRSENFTQGHQPSNETKQGKQMPPTQPLREEHRGWNSEHDVPVRCRGIIQLLFIFIGKIYVRRGTVPHTVPPYFPCS